MSRLIRIYAGSSKLARGEARQIAAALEGRLVAHAHDATLGFDYTDVETAFTCAACECVADMIGFSDLHAVEAPNS